MIRPRRTISAPTAGFGLVHPRPRRASRKAARMKCSSFMAGNPLNSQPSTLNSLSCLAERRLNPELPAVSLRFREKQSLYHSLGQLLRSGVTFPAALRSLTATSRGGLRQLLRQLNRSIENGSTVAEAFAAQRPAVSEMEAGIVAA